MNQLAPDPNGGKGLADDVRPGLTASCFFAVGRHREFEQPLIIVPERGFRIKTMIQQTITQFVDAPLVFEDRLIGNPTGQEAFHERRMNRFFSHACQRLIKLGEITDKEIQVVVFQEGPRIAVAHFFQIAQAPHDVIVELGLVLKIDPLLAFAHFEQRRLGDVEVAFLDHLLHLAIEKSQQKRADM